MGKSSTPLVKILIDADVLIHLFKADKISLLNELYPRRVYVLDMVLSELKENRTIRNNIDSIMIFSGIQEIPFPTTSNPTAKGLITDEEVNKLIKKITANNESHLCCLSIDGHRMKHFDSMKVKF